MGNLVTDVWPVIEPSWFKNDFVILLDNYVPSKFWRHHCVQAFFIVAGEV